MRILNDYYYREGYKEGVFIALKAMTPPWFVVGVALALLNLYFDFWSIWLVLFILAMPIFWLMAMVWAKAIDVISKNTDTPKEGRK